MKKYLMHEDVEVFSESDYAMSCHSVDNLNIKKLLNTVSQEQSKCR
jgi:hypothetical protein